MRGHVAEFDGHSDDYDEKLNAGLAVSGESKDYFAEKRAEWLRRRLEAMDFRARDVLDFGCGTGSSVPHLERHLMPERVMGIDLSSRSVEIARARHASSRVRFVDDPAQIPKASQDLVFCNGVFHHIPPPERPAALALIRSWLRPGGHFALWDNNPLNPGARLVMSRIPFDRDAVMLSARSARRLAVESGLGHVRTDHAFIFPRALRLLRVLEPYAAALPLGAQYMVLTRRPSDATGPER